MGLGICVCTGSGHLCVQPGSGICVCNLGLVMCVYSLGLCFTCMCTSNVFVLQMYVYLKCISGFKEKLGSLEIARRERGSEKSCIFKCMCTSNVFAVTTKGPPNGCNISIGTRCCNTKGPPNCCNISIGTQCCNN